MTVELTETEVIEAMIEFEGFSPEEAALTYKARQKLPSAAFCGPKRTYPAQDARRVRNAFSRLGQFGRRLKGAVRKRIFNCLMRRAKRMNITISKDVIKKYRKVSETVENPIVEWYLDRYGPERKCEECQ